MATNIFSKIGAVLGSDFSPSMDGQEQVLWTRSTLLQVLQIFAIALLTLYGLLAIFGSAQFVSHPLYIGIKWSEAVLATFLGSLILLQRGEAVESESRIWIFSAFLGMGIFDIFCALAPADEFVYLAQCLGQFLGGIFFSMAWLKPTSENSQIRSQFPWIVGGISLMMGTAFYLFERGSWDSRTGHQSLTMVALGLNSIGALGFFRGSLFFKDQDWKFSIAYDKFFSQFGLLFVFASLLLFYSVQWGVAFWLFVFLKFFGFLSVGVFYAMHFQLVLKPYRQEAPSVSDEFEDPIEVRLKESEARFRMLADFMPQMIWTQKSEGSPNYYNRRWFQYTGLDPKMETEKVNWVTHVHPEDVMTCRRAWESARLAETSFQLECRIRNAQGKYRWHLVRALPFRIGISGALEWIGTSTDIHDQKILLEKVKQSEEYLNIAASAGRIGIWTIDPRANTVTGSPLTFRFFGVPPQMAPVHLMDFFDCILPEDQEKVFEALRLVERQKSEYFVEYRIRRRNEGVDELRWIHSRGRLVQISPDVAPLIYGVSYDITDQKATEEKLKLAMDRANEANQMKSEFLANMSHEIRTPLSAILGFADILHEGHLSELEKDHFFEIIRRNGEQLSGLINDILDLSKVESGRISLEDIEINLEDLLKEVVGSYELRARCKNLDLRLKVEDNLNRTLRTDPTRLRQILSNLLSNAIKFTDQGVVSVHAFYDPSENLIRFQVQDTGIGLSEKQKERLFQPFTQADSSTTRKYGGTGLGLILSRKLAEAFGGSLVLLSSREGVGSTFEFNLPIARSSFSISTEKSRNEFSC